MTKSNTIRLVKSDDPAPGAKLLGARGMTNDGIEVVFDRPVSLVAEEGASQFWRIPWASLGEVLLESAARNRSEVESVSLQPPQTPHP